MAMDKSADWIVGDSEDEGEVSIPAVLIDSGMQASTISNFTNSNAAQISTISQFSSTANNRCNVSTGSLLMEPPLAQPPKVPRRPRPAYTSSEAQITPFTLSQFYAESDDELASASVTKAKLSKVVPASKAKRKSTSSDPFSSSNSSKKSKPTAVITLSSDDEFNKPSSSVPLSGRTTEPATPAPSDLGRYLPSDSALPSSSITTATTPSSYVFSHMPIGTPPSSPFNAKKRKRRAVAIDDSEDDIRAAAGSSSSAAKPDQTIGISASTSCIQELHPATKKPKKPREKKGKAMPSVSKSKDGAAENGLGRAINKIAKQSNVVYKSKETIDDTSDDDLALVPPRSEKSDFIQASIPITPVDASTAPSIASSVRPSMVVSVPASMQIYAAASLDLTAMTTPHTDESAILSSPPVDVNPSLAINSVPSASSGGKDKYSNVKVKRKKEKVPPKGKSKQTKRTSREVDEASQLAEKTKTPDEVTISPKLTSSRKGAKRTVVHSDYDEGQTDTSKGAGEQTEAKDQSSGNEKAHVDARGKEGGDDDNEAVQQEQNKENSTVPALASKALALQPGPSRPSNSNSQAHTVPRKGSMTDLIRRVSARPNSPFASPSSGSFSPFHKSSRTALSRIAPLHPNRRTPPPAPPRPPPPKKSKKMLEMEERWEEELAESVEGWACMSEGERSELRRAKRDRELGYDD